VLLALMGALALQTTLAGLAIGGGVIVNLVLVAVVYAALAYGPVTGLLAGSAGGLAQDALAGGVIGIGGFSMTLVGFLVGVLGAQFIVSQPFPRLVMFVGATMVHELCFHALYALADMRAFRFDYASVLTQAMLNGLIGIIAFQVVEAGPGLLQRRRARGATLKSRRY
jgi:rod shape-determining protein MreD